MFETKRKAETVGVTRGAVNKFLQNAKVESSKTRSGNGALKYTTSGNDFVDQFTKAGKYKEPRKFSEIERDCELLWGEDPLHYSSYCQSS